MFRRDFLASLSGLALSAGTGVPAAASASVPAGPALGAGVPFSFDALIERARKLGQSAYRRRRKVGPSWQNLSYDQYRAIRYRRADALWYKPQTPYFAEFFPAGLYFSTPVNVHVVENDEARQVEFDLSLFDKTDIVPPMPAAEYAGFSGFRLAYDNGDQSTQEFMAMQGASYFRSIAAGQNYGLSARGLTLNTGTAEPEEFPDFTDYWIEKPGENAGDARIYALMDSPSVCGAYSFLVRPGTPTVIDVSAHLIPRRDLEGVGLAPLTSMFLFDETNRHRFNDFRPALHDSDGLMIRNGAGETLWRPLANHTSLQVSHFLDNNPAGFGLMQRPQKYSDFADLEAHYHKRPSLWIEPGEDWGKGAVTLVEIPADREIYDNIVAYWSPQDGITGEHSLNYRMTWGDAAPAPVSQLLPRVLNTRMGNRFEGGIIAAIDFENDAMIPEDYSEITRHIWISEGTVSDGILQRNPETGGPRLAFTFDPAGASSAEMRAQLRHNGKMISEVWLYRWTAS